MGNNCNCFQGLTKKQDVKQDVSSAWEGVHEQLPEATSRVPREAFVSYHMKKVPAKAPKRAEYEKYLNVLFDSATGLMLPAKKVDLGKHCFGYASILADEFYWNQPADRLSLKADMKPADRLAEVRKDLDVDWNIVPKDAEGRVTKAAFVEYYMKKHRAQMILQTKGDFAEFLNRDFESALAMMLPEEKSSLGGHCFRYAGLMAGEFYFDAAKQAAVGCGCNTPVADVLKVH